MTFNFYTSDDAFDIINNLPFDNAFDIINRMTFNSTALVRNKDIDNFVY